MHIHLTKPNELRSAVITGIYRVGSISTDFDEAEFPTIVIALETAERSHFLKSTTPITTGDQLHRLYECVTGYSHHPGDVVVEELLGKPVLAQLVATETWTVLRAARPFPAPPRHQARGLVIVTSDPRFSGRKDGAEAVIGGQIKRPQGEFPEPPTPRAKPIYFDIAEHRTPTLPDSLPPIVRRLIEASREFREMSEAPTPTPGKRK